MAASCIFMFTFLLFLTVLLFLFMSCGRLGWLFFANVVGGRSDFTKKQSKVHSFQLHSDNLVDKLITQIKRYLRPFSARVESVVCSHNLTR